MSAPADWPRDAIADGMPVDSALDELARVETDETKHDGLADLAFSLDGGPSGHGARVEARTLRFATLEEFAAAREASAEPLLGTPGDMALPAGGTLLLYGDGGTSKATLTIDAVLHLAAGADWIGIVTPRPLAVVVVENEGPRGPFREKLDRKLGSWTGPSFAGRVHVLEEPWARFTFAEEEHREALARFAAEHGVDLIVAGPLGSIGAEGGGTPDDVRAFERLLTDTRSRAGRPLAFWVVHHENKAGDVSGAWERMPDTLVHARLEWKERTVLHWSKTRCSTSLHGARRTLAWEPECEGFRLVDQEEDAAAKRAAEAEATDWILAYVEEHPGSRRRRSRTRSRPSTTRSTAGAEGRSRGVRSTPSSRRVPRDSP